MPVRVFPKLPTKDFLPGLVEQHVVGGEGVGVNVITATIACNTAMTAAELIANAPNSSGVAACGPIVHSLGAPPSWTIIQNFAGGAAAVGPQAIVGFQYLTADNSAVYIFAKSTTGALAGTAVRIAAVP